jgi:hypothetical protein
MNTVLQEGCCEVTDGLFERSESERGKAVAAERGNEGCDAVRAEVTWISWDPVAGWR